MLQTLFHIPVALFQSPWIWILAAAIVAAGFWQAKKTGFADAALSWGLPLGLLLLFPKFILPQITDWGIDPDSAENIVALGLPIRGYGLMMLLGIGSGIGLAVLRGRREGFGADRVISLAITIAVAGIIGARGFYVIQYWDSFSHLEFSERIVAILDMTKGGLVVFGSLIGASAAMFIWCRLKKVSFPKVADIVGPGFVVGLALGRIGCLMNGCCFGGICEDPAYGVEFPAGSPPYHKQLMSGTVLGIQSQETQASVKQQLNKTVFNAETNIDQTPWKKVIAIEARSTGELLGLEVGQHFFIQTIPHSKPAKIGFDKVLRYATQHPKKMDDIGEGSSKLILYTDSGRSKEIPWATVPKKAKAIYPTQIYSSINAMALTLIIALFYRFRKFDGQAFTLLMILYPVARFVLEQVRQDEAGQLGTSLTISQCLSLALIPIGILIMAIGIYRKWRLLPAGTVSI